MGKRDVTKIKHTILTCQGSDCRHKGAKDLEKCARRLTRELGIKRSTLLVKTKCTGLCKQGPIVMIQPNNEFLLHATEKSLRAAIHDLLEE